MIETIYDEIVLLCKKMSYRDKLRLAQLDNNGFNIEEIIERINKSKPKTRKSLNSFITSMFQFRGSISDSDRDKIISELQKNQYISIDSNNKVTYL